MKLSPDKTCPQCGGVGHYFVMPEGMNPFYMGAIAASKAAEQKTCSRCNGTGFRPTPKDDTNA